MWVFVLLGVIAALIFIVKDLLKKAVKGETSCSCGCADCAAKCGKKDSCH
ncbi:MAG: FeoB-associated Cys-rich membrane protein [Firmicutes bacterium]|nr:FeoB-associated Cys-rich membrane protein [Bacillota bacterium]